MALEEIEARTARDLGTIKLSRGGTRDIHFSFPSGILAGRTFSSELYDGTAVTTTKVNDTITVSFAPTLTDRLYEVQWTLHETTGGMKQPYFTARLEFRVDGAASDATNLSYAVVQDGLTVNIDVGVVGGSGVGITSVNGQTGPVVSLSAADVSAIPTSAKGAVNGVASLDGTGKVPQAQLPAVALTDFLGAVASQVAMLALTGQRGDWATRTDRGTDWQLIADDPTQLTSWREMTYPASPVSSVNSRTGAVTGLAEATDLAAYAPINNPIFTGIATSPAWKTTGFGSGGFSNQGRFLGVRTSSGPPTSGTFLAGDHGFDSDYVLWVCTVGGTPGTWDIRGSGRELASAEKTDANWTTTNTTPTDITVSGNPLSITFTVASRPVYVFFGAGDMQHSVANAIVAFQLLDGSTVVQFIRGTHATASGRMPVGGSHARISGAGSHTCKLQSSTTTAGTTTIPAGATNPIFLRAVEF